MAIATEPKRDIDSMEALALEYARRGWAVFPLTTPDEHGACSCREGAACEHAGKHPRFHKTLIPNGLSNASTDPDLIERWWLTWWNANIGIVCGAISGLVVIDVDGPEGEESLEELERELGALPETVEAITGRGGGRHLYFKHPGGNVSNGSSSIGYKLDVKADGGYVVGPGSLHHSGRRYMWEATHGPDDVPLAELPAPWIQKLREDKPRRAQAAQDGERVQIPRGERNKTLASLAGTMQRRGFSFDSILAALLTENQKKCDPPLEALEVEKIARSISRYPPEPTAMIDWSTAAEDFDLPELPEGDAAEPWEGPEVDEYEAADKGTRPKKMPYCGLSDTGNAERFAYMFRGEARYCQAQKAWYVWNGARWKVDDSGAVARLEKEVIRDLYRRAASAKDDDLMVKIAGWARQLQGAAKRKAMRELATGETTVTVDEMDTGPYLNCLNGMVDLTTGELRKHDRSLFPTKVCPVRYDPEARSDVFDSFLERIQPDTEIRRFLQRALGYSLLNGNPEEAIFFAYGPTNTGKSTLLEAIAKTLGDYSEQADIRTFLEKKNDDGPRPGLAKLRGARFVRSSEVKRGEKLATEVMKWISGGEEITARFLFANEFSYTPAFTIWIGTNFAPVVPDDDAAIWRRIHRIPFDQIIPEGERDPNVKATLQDPEVSGPAILAWLVRGAQEYYDNRKRRVPGLAVPDVVKADTARYREENDPLTRFIEECCILRPDLWVRVSDLRATYERWSAGTERLLNRNEFVRRLEARGLKRDRITTSLLETSESQRARVWFGIGLLDESQE
jgi:putative DNA primase/helicase